MLRLFYAAFALAVASDTGAAQALDIGGIELRLGQRADAALRSLSAYQVRFDDASKLWFVSQRAGAQAELLGHFAATEGSVSYIVKAFQIARESDTQDLYTRASTEARRRGGQLCATREVALINGRIGEIETLCGRYRLGYSFPWLSSQGPVGAGISISVRAQ